MTLEKGLETVLVLSLALIIAYLSLGGLWFLYIAMALLIIAILSKKMTLILGRLWFSFSHYFGLVMNFVIMFVIYFLILTPLAFFQKLSGKNQILKRDQKESYFFKRNHQYDIKDIEKPW